ncbi:hypothetical protein F5Y13DRAFT_94071 [Hypoxylon sp. FL1857]|nr:hypothetical protein F5Y13DRAFT_94071 [Hypoxylon sp. FL1857]
MQRLTRSSWWIERKIRIRQRWGMAETAPRGSFVPQRDSRNNEAVTHPVFGSYTVVTAPSQRDPTPDPHITNDAITVEHREIRLAPSDSLDTESRVNTNEAGHSTTIQSAIDVRQVTRAPGGRNFEVEEFPIDIPHASQHLIDLGQSQPQPQPPSAHLPHLPTRPHHATTTDTMPRVGDDHFSTNILGYVENRWRRRRDPLVINDEWRELIYDEDKTRQPILVLDPDIWQPNDPDNFHPPGMTEGVLRIRIHGQHTAIRPQNGRMVLPSTLPWWYLLWVKQYLAEKAAARAVADTDEEHELLSLAGDYGNDSEDYREFQDRDENGELRPDPANYPFRIGIFPRHPCDRWWPLS